jgi:nitroimidazol reductase NimA-like FMN-containing flavoprotein (pyridoxamine 5'-phosphate oxidase superfamily)
LKTEKKELDTAELEKEINEFLIERATKSGGKHTKAGCNLKHGYACVLSTCHNNIPRATPVDFFSEGDLTLWINAEPGGKIANIMRNPKVSIGIYERVDHAVEQKSLQLFGNAEIINLKNNPDLFNEKFISFGLNEAMAGIMEEMVEKGAIPAKTLEETTEKFTNMINMIKITAKEITLLHMRPGESTLRKMWKDGKGFLIDTGL